MQSPSRRLTDHLVFKNWESLSFICHIIGREPADDWAYVCWMVRPTRLSSRIVAVIGLLLLPRPALAEKLVFDHRLSPPLKAALDSGDAGLIDYNNADPRNVIDLIAVRGKSAQDWTEALVIIARTPDRKVRSAADWTALLQREAKSKCGSTFTELARDQISITYERRSTGCAGDYPRIALYRAIAGQHSLFLLSVLVKDDLSELARRQWLAVMSSAHLE